MYKNNYNKKTVFPHNYSKIFSRFKISYTVLWAALLKRLEIEKDNLILVSGDTGTGKSNLVGNICFKLGEKTPNFVMNDGSMMFNAEEDFIIDPEEFSYKMVTKSGNILWLDESKDAVSRRNWASKINKTIISRKNKNRKLRKIVFLLLPYEKELDTEMVKHATLWIWVKKRGLCEIYCRRSGIKGGTGLNIKAILDREEKYFKENPGSSMCPPTVHPEFVGYFAFGKLTANLDKRYQELVKLKKAVEDYSDEEKERFGIEVDKKPKDIIIDSIEKIKKKEITNKKDLWDSISEIDLEDERKVKLLNFYLKLEGWGTLNSLWKEKKENGKPKVW